MTLSQRIKELRHKQDLTLNELSKRSEVGKATLSRIEAIQHCSQSQKLRYIWTLLGNCSEEAKDYYDLRYNKILE